MLRDIPAFNICLSSQIRIVDETGLMSGFQLPADS